MLGCLYSFLSLVWPNIDNICSHMMTGRQTMNALQNWQALAVVTSRFHTDGELQQWDGWWEWLTDVGKDTAGALSHWTKPTTSGFFLQLERIQSAFTLSTNDSEEVSCIWCLVALALIGCDVSVTWRNTWENANFRPLTPTMLICTFSV